MRYEDASQNIAAATSDTATVARPDVDTLPPGSFGPATGNTILGTGTTTGAAGADSAGAQPAAIVEVTGAGGATSASGGNFQAVGQYGLLSMDTQGNFNYVRNAGTPDGVKDVFGYTLADAAGARSSTTLTIDISQVATAAAGQAVVNLPPGVELSDIKVVGRDLVITMPDGSQMVIPGGAVFVPQLMIGDVQVPASNLAALLVSSEPQPAAGQLQSSGGNFASDVPPLDPGVPLGDLIPPTELDYTPPDFEDVGQFVDDEPEITIQPDGQPASVAAVDDVFEAGLPTRNGGEPEGSGEEAAAGANGDPREATSGVIHIDSPDGVDSVTINGVVVTGVVGQTIQGQHGTLVITGFLPNGDITYTYTLNDNTSGDATHDDFTVVVTDDDGDTATATLRVDIVDDVPTARNDTDAVAAGATSADGNVMTSLGTTNSPAGRDTVGADNATLTSVASVNVPANSDSTFDASGNLVVQGQFGTLTIKADGSYVYTLNGNQGAGGTEVFRYTITDSDGDTSTATLTITVPADPVPQPSNATAIVDDDGLPAGNKDSAPGDDVVPNTDGDNNEATFSGTLTANFGTDTPGTFSLAAMHNQTAVIGQETVRYTWNDATDTLTATVEGGARDGLVLFTVELNPNGQFDVTLVNNVLQIDDGTNTENNATAVLTFTATDVDGDSTNGTLTISFDDDIPVAITPPPPPPGQPPQPLLGGQVDEDALPDGNNDSAPGDDPGGTTASGGAGSLGALFNAGADQPLTFSLSGNTSGLPTLTSNGHAVLYQVAGNTLTAYADVDGSGTINAGDTAVFTLEVNADGSWEFTLLDQLDHPTAGTEDNLLLDFSSVVVATDADGDEATGAAGAFVIDVDDDMPVASDANPITGLVDEDNLPTGNNDNAPGDDDPGNLDGDGDGTTTGGGAPSLTTLFNGGADQPLTIVLSTDTSGLTAQALTSQGAALAYDVDVDTGVLTGYVESGATAGFQPGEDRTVFTLTVNEDGTWEFDLQDQLDHPIAGTEDNLLIDFSSVITAVDADGDTAELPDDMFVIDVDDDMPKEFVDCPEVISVNSTGSTFTGSLNLPPVGADEPGTVTFGVQDGDPVLDTGGDPLTSGGEPLVYFINDQGVLEARVGDENGDVVFTITLNNNGTFTYEQFGPIDNGGGVSFDDLTSTSAGNVEFRGVGADDPATTVDLLLSAGPADGVTVNTDSDSIGAANQSMDVGETVRIDFVSNLTEDTADADNPPSGFNYGAHVSSNQFIGLIPQVQGSQSETVAFTVYALNTTNTDASEPDRNPNDGFSDSTITPITSVTVKDYLTGNETTLDISGVAVGVWTTVDFGISVMKNADGSVTFSGIQQGDSYGFTTATGEFNAVVVEAEPAGTGPVGNGSTEDSFDLGTFSIGAASSGDPVDFDVPITFTDFDGDPVLCDIEVHLGPPVTGPDVAVTVNEAGLPVVGSDAASNSETATGDLSGTVSGGTGPYTFVLVGSGDGTFGTLTLNPDGTFTYTLDTPVDSSPDANDGTNPELGADTFTYEVTDANGATTTGTISVNVIDDVPTANPDTDSVVEGGSTGGNVLTGANTTSGAVGIDVPGADGLPAAAVVGVVAGDTDADLTTGAGVGVPVDGAWGTLTLNADGTYTYTADAGTNPPPGATDTFTYTIIDNDGDASNAELVITVVDDLQPTLDVPTTGEAGTSVDEQGLPARAGPEPEGSGEAANPAPGTDQSEITSGTITFTPGDTPATVTIDGLGAGGPVTITGAGQIIEGRYGTMVIDSYNAGTGTITYTYTLNDNVDHDSQPATDPFTVRVTDVDNDFAESTLTITVVDDGPIAKDDTDEIVEGSGTSASGNVITATGTTTVPAGVDVPGADNALEIVSLSGNGSTDSNATGGYVIVGVYGTITMQADGSYVYNLSAAGQAALNALADGATLSETFTYTIEDADGSQDAADLVITLTGSNDAPSVGVDSATVSEEGLIPDGNPDTVGFPTNAADTTNSPTDSGTITITDPDGDPVTVTLTNPPAGLTSNGKNVIWTGAGTGTLTAYADVDGSGTLTAGDIQVMQITIDNSGNWTVTLNDQIDHPNTGGEDTMAFNVTVNANDGSTSSTGTLTINVEDDQPTAIAPQAITTGLDNGGGDSASAPLDVDSNVNNNVGADQPGKVIFTSASITALQGQDLKHGGVELTYVISPDGQTLSGFVDADSSGTFTAGDTAVFTMQLQPGGSSTYTVTMHAKLDTTSDINFNDGSYDFVGGNDAWAGFVPVGQEEGGAGDVPLNDDSPDLLLTPIGTGTAVNGNANSAGTTGPIAGQNIGQGEGMRLDFVEDLTGIPTPGDYGDPGEANHDFDGHYDVNGVVLRFGDGTSTQTTASFKAFVVTPEDIDDNGDDGVADPVAGTGSLVSVTSIAIIYDGETEVVEFDPLDLEQTVTVGSAGGLADRTYTVEFVQDPGSGEWYAEVTGIYDDDVRIATFAETNYNALEVLHLGPSSSDADFAITGFGAAVQTDDPITFTVPVSIQDADGDTVPAANDISVTAGATTTTTTTSLSTSMVSQEALLDDGSSLSLLSANDNGALQRAFAVGQNATFMGVVAAAGLSALHSGGGNHLVANIGDQGFDLGTLQGQPVTSISIEPQSFALSGQELATSASFQSQQVIEQSIQVHDVEMHIQTMAPVDANAPAMTELLEGTVTAAHVQTTDLGSQLSAMAVAMPSAEQLAAVSGPALDPQIAGVQHNEVVGKVLVDALNGGQAGPNLEVMLNALPGNVDASLDALASHGAAAVSNGHMANFAGFSSSHGAFTMDPMVIQQDAAPAHV